MPDEIIKRIDASGYINVTVQEYEAMTGNGQLVKVKEFDELLQEELQKARKQWLREERGMSINTYKSIRQYIKSYRPDIAMRVCESLIEEYQAELNEK